MCKLKLVSLGVFFDLFALFRSDTFIPILYSECQALFFENFIINSLSSQNNLVKWVLHFIDERAQRELNTDSTPTTSNRKSQDYFSSGAGLEGCRCVTYLG